MGQAQPSGEAEPLLRIFLKRIWPASFVPFLELPLALNQPKLHQFITLRSQRTEQDLKSLATLNRNTGPEIIVFDDRVPMPDRDAGSARMVDILKSLARIGTSRIISRRKLLGIELKRL